MQDLEHRAAQAIAGTAAQIAQAMNVLADRAASAVQHTAQSSHQAVSSLWKTGPEQLLDVLKSP